MKESTRRRKENFILKAAGRVVENKGLTNFTMEEVAEEALVTKVTLYTYFTSKENLTMAISNSIFEEMYEHIKNVAESSKNLTGLESCVSIKSGLLNFIAENPFRAIMIMEFISVYNMPKSKLSEAMANSNYRETLNESTQKLTTLINAELARGRKDGSIQSQTPSAVLFMYVWNCITGFISMISTPGFQGEGSKEFLTELVEYQEYVARVMLSTPPN